MRTYIQVVEAFGSMRVLVREQDAVAPHDRFDERDVETELRPGYLGIVIRKGRIRQAKPTATAPHLYSTGNVRTPSTTSENPNSKDLGFAERLLWRNLNGRNGSNLAGRAILLSNPLRQKKQHKNKIKFKIFVSKNLDFPDSLGLLHLTAAYKTILSIGYNRSLHWGQRGPSHFLNALRQPIS